jgi:hypothetical protein
LIRKQLIIWKICKKGDDDMAKTFSKKELERFTDVYEVIGPTIKDAAKRPSMVLTPIKREISLFADRNANVLQIASTFGKQLLFGAATEDAILAAIGLNKDQIKTAIKESNYFKKYGDLKLIDQLVFAIPLMLLSAEFYKAKKYQESEFIFTIAWYKPYATIIFKHFGKYETNEDQMMYTIENLSQKFDIKTFGNLQNTIVKKAKISYDNYIAVLTADPVTDFNLHVSFNSGIYTRISHLVKGIYRQYEANKGKYMPFESATVEGTDDDAGETFERDIQSDAAVKDSLVKKAVTNINRNPIDIQYLDVAVKYAFIESKTSKSFDVSESYYDMIQATLLEIGRKRAKDYPVIFESIIGSFLFETNPYTGKKFSARDLKTPTFINFSLTNLMKSPNTKNQNLLNVRALMDDVLIECSTAYLNSGDTKRGKIKRALYMYYLLTVQKG